MTKRREIDDPNSCLNKGLDDELKFVVRGVDVAAPDTIRDWCRRRIEKGKNLSSDLQIQEALEWADLVEKSLVGAVSDAHHSVDQTLWMARALKAEAGLQSWLACGNELLDALTDKFKPSIPSEAITVFLTGLASGIHASWLNNPPENGLTTSATWPDIGRLEIEIRRISGKTAADTIGDSTEDRPHRLSRILSLPDLIEPVPIPLLQALAKEAKGQQPRGLGSHRPDSPGPPTFSLEKWLSDFGIAIERGPDVHQGSERWILAHCPFNPAHAAPDAAVWRTLGAGRLGFKCLHASCADKGWKEFREFYEPSSDRQPFRSSSRRKPEAPLLPDPEGDGRDEILPLSAADVEAAVDAAIAADDVVAATRLAREVAGLRSIDRAVVMTKLRQHFKRRFLARDFEKAVKDAAGDGAAPPPTDNDGRTPAPPDGPDLRFFPRTDAGNGERIVALYGDEVRYCVEMKRWLVWDGVRWAVDEMNVMRQKAKMMARRLYTQGKGNSNLEGHARTTESYAGISAALGLGSASSEKGIPISAAELDQHPYLLNCPNGVIDLRDGKLLPHNREFLITKLCPVPYQPTAQCPRFVDFVQWAMGTNPEAEVSERASRLVGFIQRAFGYALTSDVSEKAIFVLHGEGGNNGKTTLLTVFRELLGKDYSGQLVIDTVMAMKNQDATTRADLADLRGVRLVVTSEVEKEHRLSEGKIKYITAGMGSIKSCRKYENPIEFEATHKLFMDCNHRPTVRGVDDAIWRRLKLIPFLVTISEEEKDERLKEKLCSEMPGILAWAVRGCIEWFARGLCDPPEVREAGQEWREHDDPLKDFIEDCCHVDSGAFVKATDLTAAYERWAKQTRERFPLGREGLAERLHAKGFEQSRSRRIDGKQARTWEGIELLLEVVKELRGGFSSSSWLDKE
jgi:P4 family phage/plasmid primase-like protien